MKTFLPIFAALSLMPSMVLAQLIEYSVESDEFGSGNVHRLMIGTTDTGMAALFVACYPENRLQLQLHTQSTIFPNDTDDDYMWLSVTHKADAADDATTSNWRMNLLQYKDAWLLDGVVELIEEMKTSNRLSLRLDTTGTIYRFDLSEAQGHLSKVQAACSARK